MDERKSVALRVKREAIPYSNRERKQWAKAMRATPVSKAPVIPTGYLKRAIEAERLARVTVKQGGVIPIAPSTQVDTAEGRVAWKAWKAREARVTVPVFTKAKAKRAADGRSDREVWYQHYKSWGIRGSK